MSDGYDLSRRKMLGGLATIGVAGAGAGMGTTAYFSDEEAFDDNQLTAGELDLVVDYWTDANSAAVAGGTVGNGRIDGDVSAQYVLNDVKPGDDGWLVFCPKVVDNPAWLWAGSNGATDFENGQTEPEAAVDDSDGGSLGGELDGAGAGELSENIQVTVSWCEVTGDLGGEDPDLDDNVETIRELNNPDDYTLADLLLELQTGELVAGLEKNEDGEWVETDDGAYPASSDSDTQTGQCICVEWTVPTDVGNVIQSDGLAFDVAFAAEQRRHNPDPQTPFGAVVGSDAELKAALDDGEPVTFAAAYSDAIPEVERTTTIDPEEPGTFDVFDVDTSGSGLDLGSEGDFRQYGYIGEDGQLSVAAGVINPDTDVLRIFVNQVEDGLLYVVVTDQPNDDGTITPLGSDPIHVAKVDASIS